MQFFHIPTISTTSAEGDWYMMTRSLLSRSLWHVLFTFLLLVTIGLGSKEFVRAASPISISSPYLTVSVNSTGVYTINAQSPAWTFGGKIGHPLSNMVVNSGSDGVGSYQEIDFKYVDSNGASRGGGTASASTSSVRCSSSG